MSKHKKPYHPDTVKRVEAESGKTIEELDSPENLQKVVNATFMPEPPADITFKVAVDMGDPADPESAAHLIMLDPIVNPHPPTEAEIAQWKAADRERKLKQLPHEEYLTCQSAWGDLSEAVNLLAKTGRWRLHTVALNSGFCMYVMVRAVGDWSENP